MRNAVIMFAMPCTLLVPRGGFGEVDVLVNQVGYHPNAPKVFRVQRASDWAGDGTFSVREVGTATDLYSGVLTREGGLWDKWYWTGDFSSLRSAGDYYVTVDINGEGGTSYDFRIGHDTLLSDTGVLVYQYFWTQRCGTAISGWHGVCHADDGIRDDNHQNIDAVGGWHDAGDYNKFTDGCQGDGVLYLLWLYDAYRSHYDTIDTDTNGIPDIVDEAVHGARWLAKMVEADGYILARTAKRRPGPTWVRPEDDTNNNIGDWDDRWIEVGSDDCPQPTMVCAALIKIHRVLESIGQPTENFASKALAIWDHRVAWSASQGHPSNLGFSLTQMWAGLNLYEVFGQQNCYDLALQRVNEVANALIANPALRDDIGSDHLAAMDLGMCAWFARNYPDTYPASNARNATQALMSHYMAGLASNPIGLIRRDENGTLRYFQSDPDWNAFFLGFNRLYLLLTWAGIEAYKTIGDPDYLRFALDQYNWVMGANYDRVCMMEEAGEFNLPKYHTRYDTIPGHEDGAQPGVVPNGYVRVYDTGLPHVDLSTNRYQSNEGWLINNANYAMALRAMLVFEDSAGYVSDTIPATMYPGQTYTVSVTMKNDSYMPWSRDGEYKLGAVDDADPFAPTRHQIEESVTVEHDEQYTWTFDMTAPMTPDVYTTDWRIVHEYVCWFGDTLTRQVEVVTPSAPGPVSNFTATAGDRKITLSWTNPSDANFAGTMIRYSTTSYPTGPTDGTLVVDKANTPGSNDGHVHDNLPNGVRHYYAAFAHDPLDLYAAPASASSMPLAPSDFDRDGDVDQEDFGVFQACLSGSGSAYPPGCEDTDLDGDEDVDQDDFGIFQACMGGANHPPGC